MLANFGSIENTLLGHLQHLQREFESSGLSGSVSKNFGMSGRGESVPVNIASTEESVDIFMYVSGLEASKINVSVKENILGIQAERDSTSTEDKVVHMRERQSAMVEQYIALPKDVDAEKISAKYSDGVLHVSIARREETKPRKITVQ